jgi:PAS domain S-box-containing protein
MISLAGEILASAAPVAEPLQTTTVQAVERSLKKCAPALSGIYRCQAGHVHIDAAAPVCDEAGKPVAAFILRADASDFLYPLIRFWPTDSPSAETLLARREGDEVVFLNDVRFSAGAALSMRFPIDQKSLPAVQAVLGVRGIFEGKDYRGVDVLAYLQPIAESDWALVAKIDQSEVKAELRHHAAIISRFSLLGILLAAALIASSFRKRQSRLYRNLYQVEREQREAHEKFETILYSIGDAVMVTDKEARVRQMNAVAEHLTGWKEAEANGKTLEEVFRIVNEETRQTVENPVWRVLREGKIVGLANHTVLIARDGVERPIADSGAPIHD